MNIHELLLVVDVTNTSSLNNHFQKENSNGNIFHRQYAVITPEHVITNVAVPLTRSLISKITDAFHCSPVLEALGIFQIGNVPDNMASYREVSTCIHYNW